MDEPPARLSYLLQVATLVLLGVLLFCQLTLSVRGPMSSQSVTHDLPGGDVTTDRLPNETLEDWKDRHAAAVEAFE